MRTKAFGVTAAHSFRQLLESGRFAVTAEIAPPRGASLEPLTLSVRDLKPVVSAINLTDGAGARVRMSSLAAAIHVKQLGVDPILQVTCRDRNRIAIQSDLLGAAAFGIANVLALYGDGIDAGDDPAAKPVFDLDARALLSAVQSMTVDGATLSGSELSTKAEFFPGAVDVPVDPGDDWSPQSLRMKKEAGARFVQAQFCFDMELLARYIDRLRDHGLTEEMYFLVGLGPLRSADGARWMRNNLHGTVIPDGIIRRLEAARDPRHEGIAICAELMQQAREIDGVAGVHLMAPGQHQSIVEAVKLAGLV
ncbi:MAG: methylenetetrahydrofolate reductase [Woeseiaceae bacterium]